MTLTRAQRAQWYRNLILFLSYRLFRTPLSREYQDARVANKIVKRLPRDLIRVIVEMMPDPNFTPIKSESLVDFFSCCRCYDRCYDISPMLGGLRANYYGDEIVIPFYSIDFSPLNGLQD
jgi:hypothetical protein